MPKYEYTSLERVNVSGLRPFRKRPPTYLQYKLKIDDQIVTLTLKPNTQVLAPGMLLGTIISGDRVWGSKNVRPFLRITCMNIWFMRITLSRLWNKGGFYGNKKSPFSDEDLGKFLIFFKTWIVGTSKNRLIESTS